MEILRDIFSVMLYVVITGCGIVVVKMILDFINAKIDELQATTKLTEHEKLNKVIDQAQSVITTIVQSINQTFVSDLKKSGEFTKESATQAKDMALQMANELITEEIIAAIEQIYGNADEYLDALVEQMVNELKNK